MVSSELSDKKPGVVTAFHVVIVMAVAVVIIAVFLLWQKTSNTYDLDRAAKRYENLKKLNEENAKKTNEFAILDKAKGVYQLPIKNAIALTAKELAAIKPHSAYPMATPAAPAASPKPGESPAPSSAATPAVTP